MKLITLRGIYFFRKNEKKRKNIFTFFDFQKNIFETENLLRKSLIKSTFLGKSKNFQIFQKSISKKVDFIKDFLSKNFRLEKIFFENQKSEKVFLLFVFWEKINSSKCN